MTPSTVLQKIGRTVRREGPLGLIRVTCNTVRIAILKQTPMRRRARREELDFNLRYGTDTAGTLVVEETLPNVEHAVRYQASGRDVFDDILATLPVDCSRFTFLDMGSGKGRALLFASHHPFKRIIGVEFSPRLHAIATRNARVYSSPGQKCTRIEPTLGDAAEFELPPGPLFIFMYNPFSEPIMSRFARNLQRALEASPRETWLVYINPLERACFDAAPWLRLHHQAADWIAYRTP